MQPIGTSINNLRENLRSCNELTEPEKLAIVRAMFVHADLESEPSKDDSDGQERLADDFLETSGGHVYLVRDTEDDFKFMLGHMNPDIRLPLDHVLVGNDRDGDKNCNLDFSQYFNTEKTVAGIGVATNNGGGAMFIITQALMDKYPTVRQHIEHGLDWVERTPAFISDADFIKLLEAVKVDVV